MPQLNVPKQFTFSDDKGVETHYPQGVHKIDKDTADAMRDKDGNLHWFVAANGAEIFADNAKIGAEGGDVTDAAYVGDLEGKVDALLAENAELKVKLDAAGNVEALTSQVASLTAELDKAKSAQADALAVANREHGARVEALNAEMDKVTKAKAKSDEALEKVTKERDEARAEAVKAKAPK